MTSLFLQLMFFFNSLFKLSESTQPERSASFTMVDSAAVAAEVGFHQWSLFLTLLGPTGPWSAIHIRLDHQGLLPLLLLLLFKECSLTFQANGKIKVEFQQIEKVTIFTDLHWSNDIRDQMSPCLPWLSTSMPCLKVVDNRFSRRLSFAIHY